MPTWIVLSHDVGVPLLHSQTCRKDALPCQDGLRLAFPLFIWTLLADIISPQSCLVTCLRATPAYSRVWPDDRPFLHCAYGDLPCSSSVYTSIPRTQNRAILTSDVFIQNNRTPVCGQTRVPSCSVSTGSYCVLLTWIPLIPARKTVL